MWIVAVAWIYVVALMAATEPSIVHGIMTFLCYCVLPLSIVFYLTGSKRRRARREALAEQDDGSAPMGAPAASVPPFKTSKAGAADGGGPDGDADGGGDGGGGD